MNNKLKILLPIILPNAASLYPFTEDIMFTNNSGVEVPKATTVRPMARFEILNFFATDEDPLTKKSAPFIRIINPSANKMNENNMEFKI